MCSLHGAHWQDRSGRWPIDRTERASERDLNWHTRARVSQKGLLKALTVAQYTRHHLYQIEKTEQAKLAATKKLGINLRKHVVILDIDGVGWGACAQLCLLAQSSTATTTTTDHLNNDTVELTKNLIKLDESHFPEGMRKMFIINAPWIFNAMWKVRRPGCVAMTTADSLTRPRCEIRR